MKKIFIIFKFLALFGCITAAKFPSDLEKCHFGDKECLKRVIPLYASKFRQGRRDLNLVSIDPLYVNEVRVIQGANSPVNVNLKFRDIKSYGLSTLKVLDLVGFERDPLKSKFEISIRIPTMSLIGQYKARGNILLLPIFGSGPASFTFDNVDANIKFVTKVETKKSKQFIRIHDVSLDFNTTRIWMNFESLFNGDKLLSDTTNQFLNDNWMDIFNEMKTTLTTTTGEIYKTVAEPVFIKYPYAEYFLSD